MEEPVVRVAAQPLSGARVAFTGKLASMTHPRAREAVRDAGGVPTVEVSRRTSLLVVGMHGWQLDRRQGLVQGPRELLGACCLLGSRSASTRRCRKADRRRRNSAHL